MSFGLRKLKKQSEDSTTHLESQYVETIIFGQDVSCYLLYFSLLNKEPASSIAMINDHPLSYDQYKDWALGPIQFYRTKESSSEEDCLFYKDQQWHPFSGRIKPIHPLTEIEQYFCFSSKQHSRVLSLEGAFDEGLTQNFWNAQVKKIETYSSEDLLEPANWKITLADDRVIKAKKIFWAKSLKEFKKVFVGQLTESVMEHVLKSSEIIVLYVQFEIPKSLMEEGKTYFLPYSISNNQGYFIVESRENGNCTKLGAIYLGASQDEQQSLRDIRHLKKLLKKVFPQLESHLEFEKILASKDMFFHTERLENSLQLPAHFEFIGNASEYDDELFFAKSIKSIVEFLP